MKAPTSLEETVRVLRPAEVEAPHALLSDLIEMRNTAMVADDFTTAVLLSHTIAWMNWAQAVLNAAEVK